MNRSIFSKLVPFSCALALSLFAPYILPPHVTGVYIPLISLLFEKEVWQGAAGKMFYIIFLGEGLVYFTLALIVVQFFGRIVFGRRPPK